MQPLLHTATAESAPLPAQPDLQLDTSGDTRPPLLRPPRLLPVILVVGLSVGTVLWLGFHKKAASTRNPGQDRSGLLDSSAQALRLKGTTEAVQSRAILAPLLAGQQVATLTITRLAASGSRVKRGDPIAEFDRQAQTRDFLDKQADYAKLADQVLEEQAKENAARAKDETELKQAEDNLRKTELEMQKVEILSEIDTEKAQENLDEARATLQQLQETFELKRKAAAAAISILEIQRDRTRQSMLHAQANADLMQIHSPLDGVVVLNTIWKQGKMGEVQEGDQLRPGVSFMQVVDPSIMQVSVAANQEDFFSLHVGQTARVHLDAYPELVFPAKLEEIAPLGRSGDFSNKLHSFGVVFSIQGNDARLMPDLSAAVDVDVSEQGGRAGAKQ
ncbi:MAG: efflux RND transporter periplasmic adaptor subunit [Terriglobales bacterium]